MDYSLDISLPCFSLAHRMESRSWMFVVKWDSESCDSRLGRVQLIAVFTDKYGLQRMVQGLYYSF